MNNPYKILGVRKNAKIENIKKAFRKLSKKHHPDKGGDEKEFQKINDAWEILKDPEKRAHYDKTGEAQSAINEDSLAVQLIIEIFSKWLNDMDKKGSGFFGRSLNIDLVKFIKTEIKDMISEVKEFKKAKERTIHRLNKIREKCKGGFDVIIDVKIEDYKREIENTVNPHLEGLEGALEALDDGSWVYAFEDEAVVNLVDTREISRGITERIYE